MLCSYGLRPALIPFMDWPEVKPLLRQPDLLHRNVQELMDEFQIQILEPFRTTTVSYQVEKEGDHPGLTLDTQGFSPEELSVRQVGGKLRVSGKTEKRQEDGEGCCSYRRQEFTQEFDLPQGLNPDAIACRLAPDGKIHIRAADAPSVAGTELNIERILEEETPSTDLETWTEI